MQLLLQNLLFLMLRLLAQLSNGIIIKSGLLFYIFLGLSSIRGNSALIVISLRNSSSWNLNAKFEILELISLIYFPLVQGAPTIDILLVLVHHYLIEVILNYHTLLLALVLVLTIGLWTL